MWDFFCIFAAIFEIKRNLTLNYTDMKRFFSLVALATMMCLTIQADSYHDALSRYMSGSGVVNPTQYSQMLEPMAQSLYPDDPNGKNVVSQYVTTQMMEDIVSIYEPAFRRHVSEAELNELVTIYTDPKYAELQKRTMAIVSNMQQSPEYQQFVRQFSEAIQNIMMGQPARDVQIADDVPAEYATAFYQFYADSRINDVLASSFQGIFTGLADKLQDSGIANPQAKVGELIQYTNKNLPKVMLALFSNQLTLNDVKLVAGMTKKTSYQHAMDAVIEMSADTMQLGIDIITKMAEWMGQYYPKYAAPLYDTLKMLK